MVRVIYLLRIKDLTERNKLITSTLNGEKWKKKNEKGKITTITDKEMVEQANNLKGWSLSVYKFGCAFIHLSKYKEFILLLC